MSSSPHRPPAECIAAAPDPRRYAPATQRNREPILEVLSRVLPGSGRVLEIASGTGEHAVWFAQHLRPLEWQPSDQDPEMLRSIAGFAADAQCPTLKDPVALDVMEPVWPVGKAAAMVCINLLHIAPWAVAEGLMSGAGRVLPPGGVLYLYGPYRRDGRHTAPSNEAFDASLRSQNPQWGVRDLETVVALAEAYGMKLQEVVEMPANNLSVVLVRA